MTIEQLESSARVEWSGCSNTPPLVEYLMQKCDRWPFIEWTSQPSSWPVHRSKGLGWRIMKKTGAKKLRGKSKSNKWGGLLPKKHCLSLLVTMGWSNSLSKWRLRWWHEDQQSFQSPSEPCPEHKMAQANLLAMILEQVEQSMGKPGLFWLKWLEIMGSECSLPWDSESRSPSPTYGRYIHCTWYNTDFRSSDF